MDKGGQCLAPLVSEPVVVEREPVVVEREFDLLLPGLRQKIQRNQGRILLKGIK